MNISTFSPRHLLPDAFRTEHLADFLYEHLVPFGDKREDIIKAIQYALDHGRGGLILVYHKEEEILGVVVLNATGMEGYIPANILVYIAVHPSLRGQGLGRTLIEKALALTQGGVALHVEPDNPARRLYERLGFTNKYLEMRFDHQSPKV
jgi:[ribosomal protein S18]-alanine N-acetyltransferase